MRRRVNSTSSSDSPVQHTAQSVAAQQASENSDNEPIPRVRPPSTRASASKASKAWEDLVPKSRVQQGNPGLKKTKDPRSSTKPNGSKPTPIPAQAKYALPDIPLSSSDEDEVPPSLKTTKPRAGKKATMPSESKSNEKLKLRTSDNDSESDPEEDVDELDSESESGSESSGLEELEAKNPSAVEAKFAEEAATWVDGEPDDAPQDNDLYLDTLPTYLSSFKSPAASPAQSPNRSPTHSPNHLPICSPTRSPPIFATLPSPMPSRVGSNEPTLAGKSLTSSTHGSIRSHVSSPIHSPNQSPSRSSPAHSPTHSIPGSRLQLRTPSPPPASQKRWRATADSSEDEDTGPHSLPLPLPKKKTHEPRGREHHRDECREQTRDLRDHDEKMRKREKVRDRREREREREQARKRERDRKREREHERETQREREQEKQREREREKQREREQEKRREQEKWEKARERERAREWERARERDGRDGTSAHKSDDKRRSKSEVEPRGQDRAEGTGVPSKGAHEYKDTCSTNGHGKESKHDGNLGGDHTPQKSRVKRKRQDENISWVTETGCEDSKPSRPRKRRNPDDDESDLASDCDDNDQRIDIVGAHAPRPNLGDQYPRVYRVAVRAIKEVEMHIGTVNAFPEGEADGREYLRKILIKHAMTLKYKDMTKRLRDDKNKKYWRKFASIAAQRVSLLRGKVKKLCEGIVRATYGLTVGDSAKVTWLLQGIAYTFPHDYKARSVVRNKPFGLPVFEDMLQVTFFNKRTSYGHCVSHLFTSSLPDRPDEKEIPATMLALVSTAIYAAIDDFKYNRYETQKFEANTFIQAYRKNMQNLSEIKTKNSGAYHKLMHGLYLRVTGTLHQYFPDSINAS